MDVGAKPSLRVSSPRPLLIRVGANTKLLEKVPPDAGMLAVDSGVDAEASISGRPNKLGLDADRDEPSAEFFQMPHVCNTRPLLRRPRLLQTDQ